MKKIAVVYWSGTGNTEAMAGFVCDGIQAAGAESVLLTAAQLSADQVAEFDGIAFGCPAMGAEELEADEFAPMFSACEAALNGKNIALFGSYGWGDGEWMERWTADCKRIGANLVCDSVICCEAPDEDAQQSCKALGKALVQSA